MKNLKLTCPAPRSGKWGAETFPALAVPSPKLSCRGATPLHVSLWVTLPSHFPSLGFIVFICETEAGDR